MWKVNLTMDDAESICELLNGYLSSLPSSSTEERTRVSQMKSQLEDLITVVKKENRIVTEYIEDIKANKLSKNLKNA